MKLKINETTIRLHEGYGANKRHDPVRASASATVEGLGKIYIDWNISSDVVEAIEAQVKEAIISKFKLIEPTPVKEENAND